jgi:hypothetical protein
MAVLASDITAVAASLLAEDTVDANRELYHDATLLPYLQFAFEDFLEDLQANEVPVLSEISTVITIPQGQKVISEGFGLPADFIDPIQLRERAGSTNNVFIEMKEVDFEPQVDPTNYLRYWTYREGEIKLIGANRDIDVLLYYVKDLTISGLSTPVTIRRAKGILAPRLASLAALQIGENAQLAQANDNLYTSALNKYLGIQVRRRQSLPSRRPGFRSRRGVRRWPQP